MTSVNKQGVVYSDKWADAQLIHLQNPDSFEVPTRGELKECGLGDLVKICNGEERFWVKIHCVYIGSDRLLGIIDNKLIGDKPYNLGDYVEFEKCNIYSIYKDVKSMELKND